MINRVCVIGVAFGDMEPGEQPLEAAIRLASTRGCGILNWRRVATVESPDVRTVYFVPGSMPRTGEPLGWLMSLALDPTVTRPVYIQVT